MVMFLYKQSCINDKKAVLKFSMQENPCCRPVGPTFWISGECKDTGDRSALELGSEGFEMRNEDVNWQCVQLKESGILT